MNCNSESVPQRKNKKNDGRKKKYYEYESDDFTNPTQYRILEEWDKGKDENKVGNLSLFKVK